MQTVAPVWSDLVDVTAPLRTCWVIYSGLDLTSLHNPVLKTPILRLCVSAPCWVISSPLFQSCAVLSSGPLQARFNWAAGVSSWFQFKSRCQRSTSPLVLASALAVNVTDPLQICSCTSRGDRHPVGDSLVMADLYPSVHEALDKTQASIANTLSFWLSNMKYLGLK